MDLIFIVGQSEYDAVREAIQVSLDEDGLSNATIARDQWGGQAERYVLDRTLNDDPNTPAGGHAKRAAIYYAAALLIPSVPKVQSEDLAGGRYTLERTDWEARQAELYGLADSEISAAEALSPTQPPMGVDDGVAVGFEAVGRDYGWPEGSERSWPWRL